MNFGSFYPLHLFTNMFFSLIMMREWNTELKLVTLWLLWYLPIMFSRFFFQKSIYVRNRRDMAVNALLNIPTKIRFLGLIFSLIIPDKWSSRICSKTWVNRCQTSGNTFSAKVQTKHAICTVNTRNLQIFHALNFTHYGVQPLRQPPTLPFLGEGVFTMGGPFW